MRQHADTIYSSRASDRQVKFPRRRRRVRPARMPCLTMAEQATLTQLAFQCPPSSYETSKDGSRHRRKRRKIDQIIRRQTTLTQLDWSFSSACSQDSAVQLDQRVERRQHRPVSIPINASNARLPHDGNATDTILCPETPPRMLKREIPSSTSPQTILMSKPRYNAERVHFQHMSPLREKSYDPGIRASPDRAALRQSPDNVNRAVSENDETTAAASVEDILNTPAKHVSFVQDTQFETLDAELSLGGMSRGEVDRSQFVPDSTINEPSFAGRTQLDLLTFTDPVCSALYRDAARYMEHSDIHSPTASQRSVDAAASAVESPTSVRSTHSQFHAIAAEILVAPRVEVCDSDDEDIEILYSSPIARRHKSDVVDLTMCGDEDHGTRSFEFPSSMHDHESKAHEDHMHSSPLPMLASQATTVGPTQASPTAMRDSPRRIELEDSQTGIHDLADASSPALPANELLPRSSFSLFTSDSAAHCGLDLGVTNDVGERKRRLKRAHEIMPDSLLELSLPAAPDYRDYTLPPPSSSWRNRITHNDNE